MIFESVARVKRSTCAYMRLPSSHTIGTSYLRSLLNMLMTTLVGVVLWTFMRTCSWEGVDVRISFLGTQVTGRLHSKCTGRPRRGPAIERHIFCSPDNTPLSRSNVPCSSTEYADTQTIQRLNQLLAADSSSHVHRPHTVRMIISKT